MDIFDSLAGFELKNEAILHHDIHAIPAVQLGPLIDDGKWLLSLETYVSNAIRDLNEVVSGRIKIFGIPGAQFYSDTNGRCDLKSIGQSPMVFSS